MKQDPQTELAAITSKMLNGQLHYLQGALKLVELRNDVGAYENDPDFIAFVAIKTDLDHQPFDVESENWIDEASKNHPDELNASLIWAKQISWQQCINLSERYGG